MYQNTLEQLGLTKNEALVYQALLKLGQSPISPILKETKLKKGNTYNILYDLIDKKLVSQFTKNKKTYFQIESPINLQNLIDSKDKSIDQIKKSLADIMPGLESDYRLTTEKPVIQFFEGEDGLKKIYDDILNTNKDFLLIRSIKEPTYTKVVEKIVNQFIKKRIAKKIKVDAITPKDKMIKPELDKIRLMTRTMISPNLYNAPVEIDIYGDKIAILSFKKELIGMIIQSPQITQAFKQVFNLAKKGAKS